MTPFNPDFWEVTLASDSWDTFSLEDGLWHETVENTAAHRQRTERTGSSWSVIRPIMDAVLTSRQHEVVSLYFFAELNQRQIAERLGISQQAVSEHLYGKVRNGRAVGGALRKLRKACVKRGIRWQP